MARLLTPRDYGLVGITVALPGIVSSLGDFGAMRCYVQLRDLPEQEVRDTALAIGVALSLFYAVVYLACGAWVSIHYHDSRLIWISVVQAATGLLAMIYSFQLAGLSRNLNFGSEARQNIIFSTVQAVSGISFALYGFGVFALVLQSLAAQLAANISVLRVSTLMWPRSFSRRTFARFWRLGWRTTLSQYLNSVQLNVANLGVGFLFGPASLGQFGRACQIRDLIGYSVFAAFDRLLFPLFSRDQQNRERLRDIFEKGNSAVFLVSALAGTMLASAGDKIVVVLLGSQWQLAGVLVRILALGLIFGALATAPIALTQAVGRPLIWARFVTASFPFLLVALVVGWLYGLVWLCAAMALIQSVYGIMLFNWARSYFDVDYGHAYRSLFTVWLAAGISLLVGCLDRFLSRGCSPTIAILLVCLGCGLAFFTTVTLFDRQLLKQLHGFAFPKDV